MATSPELTFLDSARYLYLRQLAEPRDNSLRLVVQEALANADSLVARILSFRIGELMTEASPIESNAACRTFELTWTHYVAYLVTEEVVGSCGKYDDEVFTGSAFASIQNRIFLSTSRETLAATPRKSFITS